MKKGIIFALTAYLLWGFYPLYFKLLESVPAAQIIGHRIFWSFIVLLLVVLLRREIVRLVKSVNRRILAVYCAAGILLTINWGTYVWAVNSGHVVESSLGYFINPLVSVLLGTLFLREKLRALQWVPVALAATSVTYLTISLGQLPWISLVLAITFGLYGLIKKVAPLNALHGLTLETAAVFLPALGFLLFLEFHGAGSFVHAGAGITLLLALAGPVTVIPLIFFANGARRIPLSTVGILQYVSPTLQFLIGVLVYREPFDIDHLVGFSIIWLALILFTVEGLSNQRHEKALALNHSVDSRIVS